MQGETIPPHTTIEQAQAAVEWIDQTKGVEIAQHILGMCGEVVAFA